MSVFERDIEKEREGVLKVGKRGVKRQRNECIMKIQRWGMKRKNLRKITRMGEKHLQRQR